MKPESKMEHTVIGCIYKGFVLISAGGCCGECSGLRFGW